MGKAAIRLLNEGNPESALLLIEEACRINHNRLGHVEGLEYVKALCLARLDRYADALMFARQDHVYNLANRDKSEALVKQLEDVSHIGSIGIM